MTGGRGTVHSVVQLFIYFRWFVRSVSRSLVFAGVRSMDRLVVKSVIRLSVRWGFRWFVHLRFGFVQFLLHWSDAQARQKSRKSSQVKEVAT